MLYVKPTPILNLLKKEFPNTNVELSEVNKKLLEKQV